VAAEKLPEQLYWFQRPLSKLLFCLLILSDVDWMHFVAFLLLHVKRLQLNIDLCLQEGWLRI